MFSQSSIIQGEAGPEATTSALISDISSILRGNIKFPFSISEKGEKLKFENIREIFFSTLRFGEDKSESCLILLKFFLKIMFRLRDSYKIQIKIKNLHQ